MTFSKGMLSTLFVLRRFLKLNLTWLGGARYANECIKRNEKKKSLMKSALMKMEFTIIVL